MKMRLDGSIRTFAGPNGQYLHGLQVKGKDTELSLILDNRIDEFRCDLVRLGSEPVDQRGITEDIDGAWNPATGIGNHLACVVGKQLRVRSHSSQTKVDVFADFMSIQGPKMEVRRYPLRKLHQLRRTKHGL
jgi:hypothetical protein